MGIDDNNSGKELQTQLEADHSGIARFPPLRTAVGTGDSG